MCKKESNRLFSFMYYDGFPFELLGIEFCVSNAIVHIYHGKSQTGFHLVRVNKVDTKSVKLSSIKKSRFLLIGRKHFETPNLFFE